MREEITFSYRGWDKVITITGTAQGYYMVFDDETKVNWGFNEWEEAHEWAIDYIERNYNVTEADFK